MVDNELGSSGMGFTFVVFLTLVLMPFYVEQGVRIVGWGLFDAAQPWIGFSASKAGFSGGVGDAAGGPACGGFGGDAFGAVAGGRAAGDGFESWMGVTHGFHSFGI